MYLCKNLKRSIMSEKESKKCCCSGRKSTVVFWSIVLLLALFLLLKNTGFFADSYGAVFATWPLILFVVSIFFFLKCKCISGSFFLFAAGFFWIPIFKAQFPDLLPMVPSEGFLCSYWYLLIIFFAFLMIVKQLFCKKNKHYHHWENWHKTNYCREYTAPTNKERGGFIESDAVFNSNDRIYLNEDFTGGSFKAVFGSQKIDLRKCTIRNNEKAYIDVKVVFGSCGIWIPSDWKIQFDVEGVFSSIEDLRHDKPADNENKNILVITGSCVFSSLEVRN